MIVDTSVWVRHLGKGEPRLREHLERGIVSIHPFIIGELACGNLGNRYEVLSLLASRPQAPVVEHSELLGLVDGNTSSGEVLVGSMLTSSPRRVYRACLYGPSIVGCLRPPLRWG